MSDAGTDPVRSLLGASHLLPADRLGTVVTEHARMLGARETVVYLAEYGQRHLVPVLGEGVPARDSVAVDDPMGGRAFRRVELVRSARDDGTVTVWTPLLDGAERVGVLEFVFDEEPSATVVAELKVLTSVVAELAVTRNLYSDVFDHLRRDRSLTLAAEIQWELLPPLTFATDRVVISGILEPAYEIGGDTFDYAVNGAEADLLALDAVGHGLPAALLAGAALGAYRHARRQQRSLPEISADMNALIADHFAGSRFATALLARLDLDSGRLRWVNAGHPAPLVLRHGALVTPPACPSSLPLGLQRGPAHECETQLHPGDRVLLYTDGVVEARAPDGEFFGEERLADFVVRAEAAGDPPPETLRRLMRNVMDHQAGHLQDDASIVLVEWRTGRDEQLLL